MEEAADNYTQSSDDKKPHPGDENAEMASILLLLNQPLKQLKKTLGSLKSSSLEFHYNSLHNFLSNGLRNYNDIGLVLSLSIQQKYVFIPSAPNVDKQIRYLYDQILLDKFENMSEELKALDRMSAPLNLETADKEDIETADKEDIDKEDPTDNNEDEEAYINQRQLVPYQVD